MCKYSGCDKKLNGFCGSQGDPTSCAYKSMILKNKSRYASKAAETKAEARAQEAARVGSFEDYCPLAKDSGYF